MKEENLWEEISLEKLTIGDLKKFQESGKEGIIDGNKKALKIKIEKGEKLEEN